MADDDREAGTGGAGKNQGSVGLGKLVLVSLLSSLLVAGGVGAGVYFLVQADLAAQRQGEDGDAEEEAKKKPTEPPIYLELEEPFIANLSAKSTRFLQVTVELMARDEDVIDAVQQHRPLLRNNLLLLFSGQTPESIGSAEGKDELRRAALAEVQDVLEGLGEPAAVEDLYFTSMVVQ